jgi:hypothetical protein
MRHSRARFPRATLPSALLAVGLAAASCTDDRTEIIVVVDTDFDVPGELSAIRIEATSPQGDRKDSVAEGLTRAGLPVFVGLVHTEGPLGPFEVRAVGLLGTTEVIERRARVSFVEGRTLTLELHLVRGCLDAECGQDRTCWERGCRSIDVEESELEGWTGTPPRIGGPADGDADLDADFDAPDTGCGDFDFQVRPGAPPDLVLVVDRSLSMDDDIEARTSKWEALLDAVETMTTALEASVHFGLAIYPGEGGYDLCVPGGVVIEPEPNAADEINGYLRDAGTSGATPTAETLLAVGDHLAIPRAGHEGDTPAILLATDGAPNCNGALDGGSCQCTVGGGNCGDGLYCLDAERTYGAIDTVAGGAPRIPVYVVGLPGTEDYADVLSEMARRGGTARPGDPAYYATNDAAALEAALVEISSGLVTCVFETDVAPEDPRRVRVLLDGVEVPHSDDRSEGWDFTDPGNTMIEVFGSWCDSLSDGGSHVLTASYECMTVW